LESGDIDPFRTVIHIADLGRLAVERGERPKYLRPFMQAVAEQGGPLTEKAAQKFASDYITHCNDAGEHPTITGLENAAKDAKLGEVASFFVLPSIKYQGPR
jgi:hypothetical protein